MSANITEADVVNMAYKWFTMLNNHAPLEEFLPMLDLNNLEMKFPEATLRTKEDFTNWHKAVTHKFFDQSHEVKQFIITPQGDQAQVKVIVNWRAKTWEPPAATSQAICGDAFQTWTVRKDAQSGQVLIVSYSVDAFGPF